MALCGELHSKLLFASVELALQDGNLALVGFLRRAEMKGCEDHISTRAQVKPCL